MADFPAFHPELGETLGDAHHLVFPDWKKLTAEIDVKHGGVPDAGYRVERVPGTNVYILYGVDDASHTIILGCIRTYRGPVN